MKVLLVNPPRSPWNLLRERAPAEAQRYIHRKLVGPPLGLITVAAAVRDDHDVALLDAKGEYDLDPAAPPLAGLVRAWLDREQPRVVGVTTIASEFDDAMEIVRVAKEWDPSVVTVAGGLHATLCPRDFDAHPVDVLIPNEGAWPFRDLLAALEGGRPAASVPGIRVREGDRLVSTPGRAPVRDLAGDDFIAPDRSFLRRWTSTYTVGGDPRPVTYLYTSLGCPSRCSFCSIWPQHKGVFRQRRIDSIIQELRGLDEYHVVRFADANTLADPEFIDRLFDRIEAEGIRQEYVIDLRMDTAAAHPRLIEKMCRLGLRVAIAGFESPRAEELARYNKGLGPETLEAGLRVCHANGMLLRANYVVPADYDVADFEVLAGFAAAHATAYAGYTVLTPMPGTPLHVEMRDQIVDRDLRKYNFFNCVVRTRLPLDRFYEETGKLWQIRQGEHVIS